MCFEEEERRIGALRLGVYSLEMPLAVLLEQLYSHNLEPRRDGKLRVSDCFIEMWIASNEPNSG